MHVFVIILAGGLAAVCPLVVLLCRGGTASRQLVSKGKQDEVVCISDKKHDSVSSAEATLHIQNSSNFTGDNFFFFKINK